MARKQDNLSSLAGRQQRMRGLAEAAKQIARDERQAKIIHDRDLDAENDVVLRKMLELGTPLTLENYLDFAFLGNPPEGIEEDGEFLASVPDVILEGPEKVQ
jgi:hypothetical protein